MPTSLKKAIIMGNPITTTRILTIQAKAAVPAALNSCRLVSCKACNMTKNLSLH